MRFIVHVKCSTWLKSELSWTILCVCLWIGPVPCLMNSVSTVPFVKPSSLHHKRMKVVFFLKLCSNCKHILSFLKVDFSKQQISNLFNLCFPKFFLISDTVSNSSSIVVLSDGCGDSCLDTILCITEPDKHRCKSLGFVLNTLTAGSFPLVEIVQIENSYTSEGPEYVHVEENPSSEKRIISVSCKRECVMKVNLEIRGAHVPEHLVVQFKDISFEDSLFSLQNIVVDFVRTLQSNVHISDLTPLSETLGAIHLYFHNTSFVCSEESHPTSAFLLKHTFNTFFTFQETELCGVEMNVIASNSLFLSKNVFWSQGQIHFKAAQRGLFELNTVKIFHQYKPVFNIVALVMKMKVVDSSIICSEGGITIVQQDPGLLESWMEVHIENCSFHNNTKLVSGGALEFVFTSFRNQQQSHVNIDSCLFSQNVVTQGSNEAGTGGAISMHSTTFGQNSSSMLVVLIQNSQFVDNKAGNGGALYFLGTSIHMLIVESVFSFKKQDALSGKGYFILGHSDVVITRCQFITQSPFTSQSLIQLQVTDTVSSIQSVDFDVHCLPWHNLDIQKTIFPMTDAEYILRELVVSCVTCSPMYYAFSNEIFQVHYQGGQGDISVDSSFSTCLPCPTGGDCPGNNLWAKPNYWGSQTLDEVIFYQCPATYCCQGSALSPCNSYNVCARRRTGVLCSLCKEGYSLSVLSSNCVDQTLCNHPWFWAVASFAALLYMIWYTIKDEVIQLLSSAVVNNKTFAKFCHRHVSTNHGDGNGYFGILVYYVQASVIFRISFAPTNGSKLLVMCQTIETYLSLLLTFEMSYIQRDLCVIQNMSLGLKQCLKFLFLLAIFVWWLVSFGICLWISKAHKGSQQKAFAFAASVKEKLIDGLVNIIKYTYGGFTDIVFHALVCFTTNNKLVWFYDASVTCYSTWQQAMLLFATLYIIPFPLVLYLGMKLLRQNQLSGKALLFGSMCPLPCLIYMFSNKVKKKCRKQVRDVPKETERNLEGWSNRQEDLDMYTRFQGEYRDKDGAQYWESVMIMRRLLLSFATLTPNLVSQLVTSLMLCGLFLVHHKNVNPFAHSASNKVETFSLLLLCCKASINLMKAIYISLGTSPDSPQANVVNSLGIFESLCLPLLLLVILVLEIEQKMTKKNWLGFLW